MSENDFAFRLLPQFMSLSAHSFSELINSPQTKSGDLPLILNILQQYPDDPLVFTFYKTILNKYNLNRNQLNAICSQLLFVEQYAGRDGRLNQLLARKNFVKTWGEGDQSDGMKAFLKRFEKLADTVIKDAQAEVKRDIFNDTAGFQDGRDLIVEVGSTPN